MIIITVQNNNHDDSKSYASFNSINICFYSKTTLCDQTKIMRQQSRIVGNQQQIQCC